MLLGKAFYPNSLVPQIGLKTQLDSSFTCSLLVGDRNLDQGNSWIFNRFFSSLQYF